MTLPSTLDLPSGPSSPGPVGGAGENPATSPVLPRVLGLDLSLTSTGIAWPTTTTRIKPGKLRDHERLALIDAEVLNHARHATLVVIEGPSFGSKGNAYHQLAGLWWLITHTLWGHHIPVAIAPPAAVKRYATGKGNSGKDEVLAAVVRRFPSMTLSGNDEADAYMLCALGCARLGLPLVEMPKTHRAALDTVVWPAEVSA